MTTRSLYFRLRALEKRRPDPTKRRKSLMPAWMLQDFKEQGLRIDDRGCPVFHNQKPVLESEVCK